MYAVKIVSGLCLLRIWHLNISATQRLMPISWNFVVIIASIRTGVVAAIVDIWQHFVRFSCEVLSFKEGYRYSALWDSVSGLVLKWLCIYLKRWELQHSVSTMPVNRCRHTSASVKYHWKSAVSIEFLERYVFYCKHTQHAPCMLHLSFVFTIHW